MGKSIFAGTVEKPGKNRQKLAIILHCWFTAKWPLFL